MASYLPISIALIDDSPTDREIYKGMLMSVSAQYVVHEASTIESGRDLVKKLNPHCILLDLRFPEESGYDLLAELVSTREPSSPVIVLSDLSAEHLQVSAQALGAAGYLLKSSVSGKMLDDAIRNALANDCRPMPPPRKPRQGAGGEQSD